MTITLDLPHDLERELSAEAAQQGLSLDEYVLRVLVTGRATHPALRTGADLVQYWQNEGLIGSRIDIADSQEQARRIRTQAEKRLQG
jgi:hypothetical protein